jgi:sulfate transport system substrate-binding protein
VSVVDKVVDKKGSRKLAQAYLDYLYTPQGQEIAAQNYLRPRDAAVFKKYEAQFPPIKLLTINEAFGSLAAAQKTHFDDGGLFDRIYQAGAKR